MGGSMEQTGDCQLISQSHELVTFLGVSAVRCYNILYYGFITVLVQLSEQILSACHLFHLCSSIIRVMSCMGKLEGFFKLLKIKIEY